MTSRRLPEVIGHRAPWLARLISIIVTLGLVVGVPPVAGWIEPAQAAPTAVSAIIVNGFDDAEEVVSNGAMTLGSSDLEMVEETDGTQIVGLRYSTLDVPPGAVITSAYIQFRVDRKCLLHHHIELRAV